MPSASIKKKQVAQAVGACVLTLAAQQVLGAGFALQEQDGSGLGNAYAGGAAAAETASTVFWNPAGMSRFSTIQVAASVVGIFPSNKFNNDGSLPPFGQTNLGGTGGNAGTSAAVPAAYIVVPVNPSFAFGLGVSVPFGLETEWDDGWLGRYQALRSKVETINVNPAVSWKINSQFSVGVGVDYQRIKATLTQNANYSGALALAAQTAAQQGLIPAQAVGPFITATQNLDSNVSVTGDDYSWGWNIGVMWNITPDTRIGAHYRSSIKYTISGNVDFSNPALPTLPPTLAPIGAALVPVVNNVLSSGGVSADIKLPSITNVSFYTRLNPKWELMGDVQFTDWSTIKDLTFVRTTGALLSSTPENFRDAWRVSGGVSYTYNDAWKFRAGIAWDETPVNDTDRTPRLPDEDRFWLAGGVQYTWNKQWKFDLGLAYIWIQNASSNQNAGNTNQFGLIKGTYDSSVFLVGGQVSYSF
jgi:long-chain fatty acid transport protein